jgi:hypothetical protein
MNSQSVTKSGRACRIRLDMDAPEPIGEITA